MSTKVAIDNWSLQDIASLFWEGPDLDNTNIIKVSDNSYSWDEIPRLYMQVQLLLNLLSDIVLRDELIVDEKFSATWEKSPALDKLHSKNIIQQIEYPKYDSDIILLKENLLKQLCITDDMMQTQKENEQSWEEFHEVPHRYFSQIVWGSAGIISSTAKLGIPYSPYPLRASLLEQTIYSQNRQDVVQDVVHWLTNEHSKIYENITPKVTNTYVKLSLSPFAVKIIEDTDSIDNLIINAIQYREYYSKIRKWISEYQEALDQEDVKTIQKKKQLFTDISNEIKKYNGDLNDGKTGISMNLSVFSGLNFSKTINAGRIKNKFGIRSSFTKLILNKNGRQSIEKLLTLLECNGIDKVNGISEYLIRNQ